MREQDLRTVLEAQPGLVRALKHDPGLERAIKERGTQLGVAAGSSLARAAATRGERSALRLGRDHGFSLDR